MKITFEYRAAWTRIVEKQQRVYYGSWLPSSNAALRIARAAIEDGALSSFIDVQEKRNPRIVHNE